MSYLVSGNNPAAIKTAERNIFTATASQTTFTITQGYQTGDIDVYLNGVRLVDTEDYVANNGTTVVLNSGAAVGDSVVVVCFRPFQVVDFYTKSEQDTRYVNATGDTVTGRLTVITGGADGIVLGTDTQDSTTSSRLFLKTNGDAGSIYYDANGFALNTGATLTSTSGTKRFGVDMLGRITGGGASSINGAKLTVRQGGLSCTNNANELSGYIVFNARIQSGTNFVIATATGINSETMITAKVQYINIYDWSNSTIFHHGSRMASIRSSSGGGTTASSFSLGSLNSGSTSATEPTFVWTGTTTLNLNLTGASSNEGVAVISIAWRGCSIAISPST